MHPHLIRRVHLLPRDIRRVHDGRPLCAGNQPGRHGDTVRLIRRARRNVQDAAHGLDYFFRWGCCRPVIHFEMPTSVQVKSSISVESAKTAGRFLECFVIELT